MRGVICLLVKIALVLFLCFDSFSIYLVLSFKLRLNLFQIFISLEENYTFLSITEKLGPCFLVGSGTLHDLCLLIRPEFGNGLRSEACWLRRIPRL